MNKQYESIPHTADLQLRVWGKTLQELFKNALIGMSQSMQPKSRMCVLKGKKLECPDLPVTQKISVDAPDIEGLLVDFLNEALYLCDANNQLFLDVSFDTFSDTNLTGTLYGVLLDGIDLEVKATTHHGLKIEKINDQYQADIVFDI